MNRRKRAYLKYTRRVNEAFAKKRNYDKWLVLKWRAWHRLYKIKRLWSDDID